jgi:hypothetical protein
MAQQMALTTMQVLHSFPENHDVARFRKVSNVWWFYAPLHVCYLFLYGFAFNRKYGAFCDATDLFPNIFIFLNFVFFAGYLLCLYMHFQADWYLEWKTFQDESIEKAKQSVKALFERQSKLLVCFYTICIVLFGLQELVAKILNDVDGYVICSFGEFEGERWLVEHWVGVMIFCMFIFPVMISTSMPRIVFVKGANDTNFFKDQNKIEYSKTRSCCRLDLSSSNIDELTLQFKKA